MAKKKAAKKKTVKAKKKAVRKKTVKATPGSRAERFPVVGIGASAGGLEAIEGLLAKTPPETSMAFVIIQHLAPKHKSIMDTLLRKFTKMMILQIKDGMEVKPNHIYLNPPDRDVSIMNGTFYLSKPETAHAMRMPIDFFLRSLAEDQGERAICIILSGTGTDGTLGLKAVKGEGGMTMTQDENQAKYSSMPRSAINTGMVDFILPVEKMGNELMKYYSHPYMGGPKAPATIKQRQVDVLNKIFLIIRGRTGQDFSNYKLNTIRRRIERRMAVHQVDLMDDYLRYLQQNAGEVETLAKDLLIGVTNFFRDPEAFKALRKKALIPLMKRTPPHSNLRIWVPGCSTGEEAYSIAIEVIECMESMKKDFNVQIFGTDVDHDSIEHARMGIYPESISANVTPERLRRFFLKEENSYRIRKPVREMVVFAEQNLIKDPPFSKLDLVSCRNVLIYMDQVLQKKILPLFHYTLDDGGMLFLGTSETIGEFSILYSPVDVKWKIFRRKGLPSRLEYPGMIPYDITPEVQREVLPGALTEANIRQLAEDVILSDYSPPCVLVNEKLDIVYFHGKTDTYLTPPSGEPSFNILKMAREDLRYRFSTVLHKAMKQKKAATLEGLQVRHNGGVVNFDLVTRPLKDQRLKESLMLVVFEPQVTPAVKDRKRKKAVKDKEEPRILALEQELYSTKEYLQTTIEELETSNEELKSTNEELQSTNEEMQSTNEELETSREEMQSTNEELETVNSELQNKLDELSRANDDLNNLLASTELGTVFLDTDLRIKRFTPHVTRLFNLIKSDIGRPISDITSGLLYRELSSDSKKVLTTLQGLELDVQSKDGRWYSMRIIPYRTLENVIDGVVITFFDVTEMKTARAFAEAVVDTVREPLLVLDGDLRVVSANRSFYKAFKVREKETADHHIYELGNRQWDIPRLRELLEKILPESTEFNDYMVKHNFPRIGEKTMLLNARSIYHAEEKRHMILLAIEDIKEKEAGAGKATGKKAMKTRKAKRKGK
jgi:two-component system CheB/CheR fusion protein